MPTPTHRMIKNELRSIKNEREIEFLKNFALEQKIRENDPGAWKKTLLKDLFKVAIAVGITFSLNKLFK